MAASLREMMGELSLDDMVVAPDGRVVIANPEIAARISAMKTDPADPTTPTTPEPTNGRRCHVTSNGKLCTYQQQLPAPDGSGDSTR